MTVSLTTELPFTAEDVATLVQEVGLAVLDLSMVVVEHPPTGKVQGATSCVHVSGDWEGSVILEVSPTLSKQATAAMFAMEVEEIGDEEMADALGELANIIGGSIKGLMPGSCRLSLPAVTLGPDSRMVVPGAQLVHRVVFDIAGEQLVVALWKQPTGLPNPS